MEGAIGKKITIYTTPTCVYCKMAKDFFAKSGVTYTERNVVEDELARKEMVDKSHQLSSLEHSSIPTRGAPVPKRPRYFLKISSAIPVISLFFSTPKSSGSGIRKGCPSE